MAGKVYCSGRAVEPYCYSGSSSSIVMHPKDGNLSMQSAQEGKKVGQGGLDRSMGGPSDRGCRSRRSADLERQIISVCTMYVRDEAKRLSYVSITYSCTTN